jgi:hypothetical protein
MGAVFGVKNNTIIIRNTIAGIDGLVKARFGNLAISVLVLVMYLL